MKLSKFITENMEKILVEWEEFARTIHPASTTMDSLSLRDHARQILGTIVKDIESTQTDKEQTDKSKGLAPSLPGKETAATTHGVERQISGFDIKQLGSEYRALRASVIKLWKMQLTEFSDEEFNDMMFFNEAIDQALAESISSYSDGVNLSREVFLGILGHDLRGPLSSILMGNSLLSNSKQLDSDMLDMTSRIKRNATVMDTMIKDLLEYAGVENGDIPFPCLQAEN